jgi:hypothetical protein
MTDYNRDRYQRLAYPEGVNRFGGFSWRTTLRLFCVERFDYTRVMVKTLEQAIAEVERLPAEDQEQIGRTLLSHVEKLRALRAEIDKGIRSLDAGQGRESSIDDFVRQKNR